MDKQMTLSQCAQYDHETKAKTRLTGWGKICKERAANGKSRKARRLAKKVESS